MISWIVVIYGLLFECITCDTIDFNNNISTQCFCSIFWSEKPLSKVDTKKTRLLFKSPRTAYSIASSTCACWSGRVVVQIVQTSSVRGWYANLTGSVLFRSDTSNQITWRLCLQHPSTKGCVTQKGGFCVHSDHNFLFCLSQRQFLWMCIH